MAGLSGGGCENLFENLQWRLLFQLADHVRHSWNTDKNRPRARIILTISYLTMLKIYLVLKEIESPYRRPFFPSAILNRSIPFSLTVYRGTIPTGEGR